MSVTVAGKSASRQRCCSLDLPPSHLALERSGQRGLRRYPTRSVRCGPPPRRACRSPPALTSPAPPNTKPPNAPPPTPPYPPRRPAGGSWAGGRTDSQGRMDLIHHAARMVNKSLPSVRMRLRNGVVRRAPDRPTKSVTLARKSASRQACLSSTCPQLKARPLACRARPVGRRRVAARRRMDDAESGASPMHSRRPGVGFRSRDAAGRGRRGAGARSEAHPPAGSEGSREKALTRRPADAMRGYRCNNGKEVI